MLDSLLAAAHRSGPALAQRVQHLKDLTDRWHRAQDERARGGMTEAQFATLLADLAPLGDSVRRSSIELEQQVAQRNDQDQDRAGQFLLGTRSISLALGALALLAVALTAWFAWRQRTLTRALAEAVREETRLREESEQRRSDLQRVSDSKARLMRGFSHDVKNPLGAADGYMQLLRDGVLGPVSEKQAESIEKARRSLSAALRLIEDLLEMARAGAGQIEIKSTVVNVGDIIRETADEYDAQARRKGLDLKTKLPAECPRIISDPARVRQVLGNLISNAVKYTEQGSVTICLRCQENGDSPRVGVEVTDTGPGIPEEQRRLIFQEYVRLDPKASKGAGVGLAISARIVAKLGGEITVQSEEGRGSTFVFWLPANSDASVPLTR
jgi:signal transduction histidine kinase